VTLAADVDRPDRRTDCSTHAERQDEARTERRQLGSRRHDTSS
jgi:hypothetical protein